jgi:hypothetical protein
MQELVLDSTKVKALIKQCQHLNEYPMLLPRGYYGSRLPEPVLTPLAELVESCVESLSGMKEDALQSFVSDLPDWAQGLIHSGTSTARKDEFLQRVALYHVVVVLQRSYFSYEEAIVGDTCENEVFRRYPELADKIDKDGLLRIDDTVALLDVGVEYKAHVLHYHQLLRRSYSSNPNIDFISAFVNYHMKTKGTNDFRIGIDHRRIMPKEFYRQIMEKAYWFGPKFDRTDLDDPREVGVTVVKRDCPYLLDVLRSNKLDRTEFYWNYRKGTKTLEVEEISRQDYSFDSYHLNRYAHTERDISARVLTHLDGAVKVYLGESYANRLASKLPREFKCHKKIKLFRIDGDIDVDQWMDLLARFFRENEMIIEYFDPAQYEAVFGECIRRHATARPNQDESTKA